MIVIKVESMPGRVWRTEVETRQMPTNDGRTLSSVNEILYLIGAEVYDIIDIGHGIDMWVDDEGLLVPNPRPNPLATKLRIANEGNGNVRPVVGNVVLLGRGEGWKAVDLTEEQAKYVMEVLNQSV